MRSNNRNLKNIIISITSLIILANSAMAFEDRFSVMPYFSITTGNGEPAHDIPKFGVKGRYLLSPHLYLTMSLDYTEYDFERPYKLLGIDSSNETDAKVSGIVFYAGAEREFFLTDLLKPYVGGGVGITFISADTISGTSLNGDNFNISTEIGTEYIPYLNGGFRWLFWRNLSFDLGTRFEYHLSDWMITDRISRLSNNIQDYFQYGGYLGITAGF